MANYIKVHNHIINIESISKAEFISDDIYLDLFPVNEDGKVIIDFYSFTFAKLELFSGEEIEMRLDLYVPEEGENIDDWIERNRGYINLSWSTLVNCLGDIETITDFEYKY